MRLYLDEIGLLHIIDENIPQSPTKKWKGENQKVVSRIADYLDYSHLAYKKNDNPMAKEIFEDLDAVYNRKCKSARISIMSQLQDFKLAGEMPSKNHFRLFDELINDFASTGGYMAEDEKESYLIRSIPEK